MMGTRSGALDPGVLLYLMEQGWSHDAIQTLLYKQSGLLGVSGESADMRTLRASGSEAARFATDLFAHRVVREIGALSACVGGLDVLAFTGGIGEHRGQRLHGAALDVVGATTLTPLTTSAGASVGLALGVGLGLSRSFNAYVFPLFKAVSQVPVIGWLPLLMLLVGIDEALKFLLIAKAALVPVAVNTCQGIQGVANAHVEVAKVFRFTRWQLLRKVVFPAATAQIWNGLRYGFTHAWLALVVVELLASSEGIGFMIVYGRQLFQLDIVLAAVVVVGVLGYLIDKVLGAAESHLLRWRKPGL